MSEYSELLRGYIQEKDIKVDKLTQYCGVERSSMYKFINGKRKVTKKEIAKKIANYMQLSPKECEQYYEAYYRSLEGERAYRERKQLEDFICCFDEIYYAQSRKFLEVGKVIVEETTIPKVHSLKGKVEINYYIKMLLEQVAQLENPKVLLITQCDNQFLRDLLLMMGKNKKDMKIEHILCFQKSANYENMEILESIIPFYACECQYEPYYYYDEISSHFYNMNLFCNIVICETGILGYTSDYGYGQIFKEREFIQMYQEIFQQYKEQTYPLLIKIESVLNEYLSVGQDVLKGLDLEKAYTLHSEPCVVPFISRDILEKYILYELPQRVQTQEMFWKYICEEKEMLDAGKLCCNFTLQGVERFIQEGRVEEIPEDFYNPFKKSDCVKMIKDMLPYFQNGTYRLLKNRLSQINSRLHVFVAPSTGHLLFEKKEKELVYIYINEPEMLQQFMSFLKGLNEETSLYTVEEAVEKVQQIIKKYL